MQDTRKQVSLVGVPTDVGAGHRGSSMGPEAIRVAGITQTLEQLGIEVRDCGNLSGPPNPWQPPQEGYRHLEEVIAWNQLAHDALYAQLSEGRFPIMLAVIIAWAWVRSRPYHAIAGNRVASCACCGWTRTPTSIPQT